MLLARIDSWRRRRPEPTAAARVGVLASLVGFVGVAVYALAVLVDDPPIEGEYRHQVLVARWVLVAVYTLGALSSHRWRLAGASTMAFSAAALGSLHSSDHSTWSAFAVTLALWLPAILIWFAWQQGVKLTPVVAVGAVFATAFLGAGWGADRVHDHFYGPTHPSSTAELAAIDLVAWVWVGAVDDQGATVTALVDDDAASARVVVRTEDGTEAMASTPERVDHDDPVVRLRVDGLRPATRYDFAIEVDGVVDQGRPGRFATFPRGAASFTFASSSCARVGTNGAVFDAIVESDPLFFLATGDLHYRDIASDDVARFADAYASLLAEPGPSALFRSTPVDYVWDDHDFAGNNSFAQSVAAPAAQAAYRRYVPSYELPDDASIHHAFTVGRVRFVVTDGRSYRSPASAPDDEDKTMLGARQIAWFIDELEAADEAGMMVVWVQAVPWIAEAEPGADHWGGYTVERRRLADHIAELGIADRLVMISGDAHMVAFDDGTNSDYSGTGDAGFAVFHAAALDRPGMVKGGPFSGGTFPGTGQFGLVHIDDTGGDRVLVRFEGRRWDDTPILNQVLEIPMPVRGATGAT